ncbi:MAG: class I SAM-dependent DNA methyltransferase [Bacteroidales bacterium]|jgi:type I restriction enzyme M protein|nr:class I SAM-dependent DNA methyltransferase [Bacteroidales bacterium]MEE1113140.1 class I SAM-dependent DNA methyltransferase [Bacteroidales bacterium]
MAKRKENIEESLEKQLWKAADKLRKNIDAAEYKHVVLGLIFLKYISVSFEELYARLQTEVDQGADPEDREEYKAENVFYVPIQARWSTLVANAKDSKIGKIIDDAMDSIEKENPSLKGVLPKVFARPNLDATSLGELIDLIGNTTLNTSTNSADLLGHVFEYFLGEFALAEGKKGGQFYTPRSVVELLVKMLEPYKGRVLDPCCGSGGMFVQSEKFVKEHQGIINDISIYGQESNQTTWRLCKMNLAIRGIDASQVKWNTEGSFLNDAHKDVKVDYLIANPPFNDSDWSGELLRTDGRWKYGIPPIGNANFAWIQHFIYHLAPSGQAGFVLAKGALTSKSGGEGEIRKELVKAGLVDCIVNLPAKLFLNTQIPASLWFLSRNRNATERFRDRREEILFIDARNLGHLINRRTREFSHRDIQQITETYHNWRNRNGKYEDIVGFCASASIEKVAELDYVLTPGRYVGLPEEEEDFNFTERFTALKTEFEQQLKEEERLNKLILENLEKIK